MVCSVIFPGARTLWRLSEATWQVSWLYFCRTAKSIFLQCLQDRWSRELGLDSFFSAFYGRRCYAFHACLGHYVLKAPSNLEIKIPSSVCRGFRSLVYFSLLLVQGKLSCLLLSEDVHGGGVSKKSSWKKLWKLEKNEISWRFCIKSLRLITNPH